MDDSGWISLVNNYEFVSATGANVDKFMQGRPNILVGNLHHVEENLWLAMEFVPTGMSADAARADCMKMDECNPFSVISLIWDVKQVQPAKHTMYFGLNAYRAEVTDAGFDYIMDKDTMIFPIQKKDDRCIRVLSLYGGGFGGWAFALTHLNAYHDIRTQHVAVESDLQACVSYAIQHDVPVYNGFHDMPKSLFSGDFKGCIIHGHATSTQWMPPVNEWNPSIITISSPCPPWSNAAKSQGLAVQEGLLLPESILQARLFQPQAICLEQVTGFNTHPHKRMILKTISMCGYVVSWSRCLELSRFSPVHRSRWLAVLRRVYDIAPIDQPVLRHPSMSHASDIASEPVQKASAGTQVQSPKTPVDSSASESVQKASVGVHVQSVHQTIAKESNQLAAQLPYENAHHAEWVMKPRDVSQPTPSLADGMNVSQSSQARHVKAIDISPQGFFNSRCNVHDMEQQHDEQHVSTLPATLDHENNPNVVHACHVSSLQPEGFATGSHIQEACNQGAKDHGISPEGSFQVHDQNQYQTEAVSDSRVILYQRMQSTLQEYQHRKRTLDISQRATTPSFDNQLNFENNKNHTPHTFDAIFPTTATQAIDAQLMIPADMLRVAQDPEYLPPAKKRKIFMQSPMQLRTYTAHEKFPVIMASYGSHHCLPPNLLKEKGCFQFFYADEVHGLRLLHPCEIAMIHGVMGRFFAFLDFQKSWHYLGNQIAPFHALTALVAACQLIQEVTGKFQLADVFETWDFARLKASTSILTKGKAGYMLRHIQLSDDMTHEQHDNVVKFLKQYGNGIMPPNTWWDLQGLHNKGTSDGDVRDMNPIPTAHEQSPMTPATEIDPTATQPFTVTIRTVLHLPNWKSAFWVASDVPASDLSALWRTGCQPHMQDGECHIFPCQTKEINLEHSLIIFMIDRQMTVYQYDNTNFHAFCTLKLQDIPLFDPFGPICAQQSYSQHAIITTNQLAHGQIESDIMYTLAAFQNCVMGYEYDVATDRITCKVQGEATSRRLVASIIAKAIDKVTLQALGRHVSICHDLGTTIVFAPSETGTAVPPACFDLCLAVAMTSAILDTIATTGHDGVNVTLKWMSRPLWKGSLQSSITAEVLSTILMYSLSPVMHLQATRLIAHGQRFASGPLQLLQSCLNPGAHVPIAITFETWGGAGPTATKSQLKQQIRNSVAAWMLEHGIELSWVHQHLEQCIDDIGVKKLVPVINQPASNRRDSQLRQLFQEASVKLPEVQDKPKQVTNHAKAKLRKTIPLPDPTDFKLDCSYLLKEDGTPTVQLQEFRPNATGVFLTNEAGATPWMRENQQLSTDELGMIVLGPIKQETTLPQQQVVLPCFNSSTQQVLLQATLIQFGAKQIKMKEWDQNVTKSDTSKICSLTLWKQDWSQEEWDAATHQTTQFVKEIFAHEGLSSAITSVWGRSFRKGKSPCQNRDATSIQVHAAIASDQLLALLKTTGHNKVWAAPKAEDGRLTDDFRVLWLAPHVDTQKAAAFTAKISGAAGLVRGKASLGIRITSAQFDAAWKIVYPSEQVPADISNKWIYKLEPLPYGCNAAMLSEWSQHVNWTFRPLRATGPKPWLVCTGDHPPAGPLAFNGHPVLPRFMPQKQSPQMQPILAGPRVNAKAVMEPAVTQSSQPSVAQDPWWNYLQKTNPQLAAPGPSQGPVEQRFAQHEAKVQELEQKLEAIQTTQAQQTGSIKQLQVDLVNTESKIAHSLQQTMDHVKADLSKSFGEALAIQSKQFEVNMNSLKQALLQPKRKSPSEGDEDMKE